MQQPPIGIHCRSIVVENTMNNFGIFIIFRNYSGLFRSLILPEKFQIYLELWAVGKSSKMTGPVPQLHPTRSAYRSVIYGKRRKDKHHLQFELYYPLSAGHRSSLHYISVTFEATFLMGHTYRPTYIRHVYTLCHYRAWRQDHWWRQFIYLYPIYAYATSVTEMWLGYLLTGWFAAVAATLSSTRGPKATAPSTGHFVRLFIGIIWWNVCVGELDEH
jgi:hypothetical protein